MISLSKISRSFNFGYSVAVLFYINTKVKIVEAFNFHEFASPVKRAKIYHR